MKSRPQLSGNDSVKQNKSKGFRLSSNETFHNAFSSVRILDLSRGRIGYATRMLADLGAEVIQVEKPPLLSPTERAFPSHNDKQAQLLHERVGKKRLTLDLESPPGKEHFIRLVEKADIVVENFKPGYLDSMGVGFEEMRRKNSGIILVSTTRFGQSGPYSMDDDDELLLAACSGQIQATSATNDPQPKMSNDQAGFTASLYSAVAILLAMRKREQTGLGQHIDISTQACVVSTLEHVLPSLFYGGDIYKRSGTTNARTGFCILSCQDGLVQVNVYHRWHTLVEWMEGDHMAADLMDTKWEDEAYRQDNFKHILQVVSRWIRTRPRDELVHQAQSMQMAWAPVQSPAEILACPHLEYRSFFQVTNNTAGARGIKYPGLPFTIDSVRPTGSVHLPTGEDAQPTDLFIEDGHPHPGIRKSTKLENSSQIRSATKGLLQGIRVLDFTRVLAGPFATRMLADLGAEVIKVQTHRTATGTEDNQQPYFRTWNRNKRSITLDMDFIEARELVLQLVANCDIVVENFSPRVMSNWGLGFENLKKANPSIILLSMSGMGQTGPWKDYVAYGQTVQALGGLTHMTGSASGHPVGIDYAYADPISGLYGIVAILSALDDRDRTSLGYHIDLSEYEAVCTAIGPDLIKAQQPDADAFPTVNGEFNMSVFPHGVYPCRGHDRWCVLSVCEDRQWRSLCNTLNRPEWLNIVGFKTAQERHRHWEEMDRDIAIWTSTYSVDNVVNLLRKAGVPARPVSKPEDLMKDLQLRHRNFFRPLSSSKVANLMTDASPIQMDGTFKEPWQPSPVFGRDNRYVFLELLGMPESSYDLYREKGIIA